jgi:hypothetical protein
MNAFAEKNKQAKEIAELYLEKYGDDKRNKLGKIVNEQVRLVAFELISELDELKEKKQIKAQGITDLIFKVSRGLRDLEMAEKLNADRENDIRGAALEQAAKIAEKSARQDGVSSKTIQKIKKEILGL